MVAVAVAELEHLMAQQLFRAPLEVTELGHTAVAAVAAEQFLVAELEESFLPVMAGQEMEGKEDILQAVRLDPDPRKVVAEGVLVGHLIVMVEEEVREEQLIQLQGQILEVAAGVEVVEARLELLMEEENLVMGEMEFLGFLEN